MLEIKRKYEIILIGSEDSRSCTLYLSEAEVDILQRVEEFLKPDTGYIPHIKLIDLDEKSHK